MAKILTAMRLRYQSQPNIPGKPDFIVTGTRLLVFCDSSFWHGRNNHELTGKAFRKNRSFWIHKLVENRRRDFRVNRKLRATGWSVARVWDTDIIGNPEKVKSKIKRMV
jgi:DNA mismatch endonuclease (patch repair protein)